RLLVRERLGHNAVKVGGGQEISIRRIDAVEQPARVGTLPSLTVVAAFKYGAGSTAGGEKALSAGIVGEPGNVVHRQRRKKFPALTAIETAISPLRSAEEDRPRTFRGERERGHGVHRGRQRRTGPGDAVVGDQHVTASTGN